MTSRINGENSNTTWVYQDRGGANNDKAWGRALGTNGHNRNIGEDSPLSLSNLTSDTSKAMFESNKDDYIDHVLSTLEEKYEETYPDAIAMIEEMLELSDNFDDVKERLTQVAELGLENSDGAIGFKDLELLEAHGDINEDGTLSLDENYKKPEGSALGIAEYGLRMKRLFANSEGGK